MGGRRRACILFHTLFSHLHPIPVSSLSTAAVPHFFLGILSLSIVFQGRHTSPVSTILFLISAALTTNNSLQFSSCHPLLSLSSLSPACSVALLSNGVRICYYNNNNNNNNNDNNDNNDNK
jgi:hypothetical protein